MSVVLSTESYGEERSTWRNECGQRASRSIEARAGCRIHDAGDSSRVLRRLHNKLDQLTIYQLKQCTTRSVLLGRNEEVTCLLHSSLCCILSNVGASATNVTYRYVRSQYEKVLENEQLLKHVLHHGIVKSNVTKSKLVNLGRRRVEGWVDSWEAAAQTKLLAQKNISKFLGTWFCV